MREDTVETILDAWAAPPPPPETPLSTSIVPPQQNDSERMFDQMPSWHVAVSNLANNHPETAPNDFETRNDSWEFNHAITNNAPDAFQGSCDPSLPVSRPATHLTRAGRSASTLLQKPGTISSSASSLTLVADASGEAAYSNGLPQAGSQVFDLKSKTSQSPNIDSSIPCKNEGQMMIQWSSILPVLPILHIALMAVHLALSIVIPYLLVTHLIQPLVLWLIMLATLLLELGYLLAVLVLETIGVIRKRPVSVPVAR